MHTFKRLDLRLLFVALALILAEVLGCIFLFFGRLSSLPAIPQAQQPPKSPRIGFLTAGSPSTIAARIDACGKGFASSAT